MVLVDDNTIIADKEKIGNIMKIFCQYNKRIAFETTNL